MGWKPVTKAATTSGSAEGTTELNAFDNALLAAGIGNINLVKVSSILPPNTEIVDLPRRRPPRLRAPHGGGAGGGGGSRRGLGPPRRLDEEWRHHGVPRQGDP